MLTTNQDPLVNEFYEELFSHWSLKKNIPEIVVDLEDDENDVDFSDIFEVKNEVHEDEVVDCLEVSDPYMSVLEGSEGTNEPLEQATGEKEPEKDPECQGHKPLETHGECSDSQTLGPQEAPSVTPSHDSPPEDIDARIARLKCLGCKCFSFKFQPLFV